MIYDILDSAEELLDELFGPIWDAILSFGIRRLALLAVFTWQAEAVAILVLPL
jgi:hypothetical protein